MKNRTVLKRCILIVAAATVAVVILLSIAGIAEYGMYVRNYNMKLGAVADAVINRYPDVSESDLAELFNSAETGDSAFFERFGIDPGSDSAILANDRIHTAFIIINAGLLAVAALVITAVFVIYDNRKSKEISDIAETVEKINNRIYDLDMDSNSEDELSILKNEVYKATITLREAADNSARDRQNLKRSLEDISHQLKTPLTSILIMLEDLIDDPDMDSAVRDEFIRSIRREASNISFLVQSLLKLSRFDSSTIDFIKEQVNVRDIINDAVENITALCDLRNVAVRIEDGGDVSFLCDRKWQTEAITNILKNCVEHSPEGGEVGVKYGRNSVYTEIEISDRGGGISEKDLPHIFERFYKGENATPGSIGIGLALSKSIIEEDNGMITVESGAGGTVFTIKYMRF